MTLSRASQVRVLAEYRLLSETPSQRKKANAKAKRKELNRRLERFHG